jgi:hypothetical protein
MNGWFIGHAFLEHGLILISLVEYRENDGFLSINSDRDLIFRTPVTFPPMGLSNNHSGSQK